MSEQKAATKPAAVIVRVSTKQQVEKVSLDEQVSTCEKLCAERGLTVGEVFREEGISASKDTLDNRPIMRAVLDRIEAGEFGALVAFAPNRISRNDLAAQVIVLRLKLAGAVLITPEFTMNPQDPTDRLTAYMQFWSAGRDSDARTKAIKMGKRGLRSRGKFPESRTPFGYRWQKGERGVSGAGKPVLDEREAKAVKLIFRLAEAGRRPQEIADELTRRGVLTRSQQTAIDLAAQGKEPKRKAAPWDPGVIARMVARREYIGEWRTDGQTLWADAPSPLIGKTQWARAQAAVERKAVRGPRRQLRDFLLQGHLSCEKCGRRMTVAQPFNKRSWRYYRCSHRCRPNLRAQAIEEAVWAEVVSVLRAPEVLRGGMVRYREHGIEAWREERGTKELALIGCDTTIEQAEKGYLDGVFTAERTKIIQAEQAAKKADIEKQIGALTERIEKGERQEALLIATQDLAARLGDPDLMSFEDKRRALEGLGVQVILPAKESERPVIRWWGARLVAGEPDLKGGSR